MQILETERGKPHGSHSPISCTGYRSWWSCRKTLSMSCYAFRKASIPPPSLLHKLFHKKKMEKKLEGGQIDLVHLFTVDFWIPTIIKDEEEKEEEERSQ